MESNEISLHETRVFQFFKSQPENWFTNVEVAKALPEMAIRTVRKYTLKLVQMGILDQAELFPSHHYRFAEKFDKRNPAYARRLESASAIFASKQQIAVSEVK